MYKKLTLLVLALLLVFAGTVNAKSCMSYMEMPASQQECLSVLQGYIDSGELQVRPIGNTSHGYYSGIGLYFTDEFIAEATVADIIGAVVVTLKAYPNTAQVHIYCGEVLDSIFRTEVDQLCFEKF